MCDESPTPENLTGLEETRIRYESAYDYVTQGAIIRSRARWFEKGEKSNSYFLRLENQNNRSSCITKLKLDDEKVTADPVEILGEIKSFYSNLYQSHGSNHESDISARVLENPSLPKLDEDKKELCEGRLTYNECYRSLLTFQTGKAPGNDGLTVEFYKAFWPLLGNLVVDCLNEAYDYGELSTSQKMAMIKLIEKKGKDKMHIKNWRPISLLNVDVKIASKALAKRLETVLPLILHENQCAYVKGRSIFDCTRIIDDIMFYTKEKNLSGLLLAIDFEKAFDSLDWTFLNKALSACNFGQSFIKWVNTFYCNIQSCVMNNRFSSSHFDVQRGVREGDPLSPYLFIVALETLAIYIRGSDEIKGINIRNEQEIKLTAFADDMTTFLKDDQSAEKLLHVLNDFGRCSGLNLNESKLEACYLGTSSPADFQLNVDIKSCIEILGIFFSYDKKYAAKLNFESILKSLKKKLNLWKWRNLTVLGRVQIVKTFAISKFLYRASQLPLSSEIIKSANKIIYDFIWKGKDKVKRRALVNNIENGTLKMIHLESLIQSQKMSFFKRYLDPEYVADWKIVLNTLLTPVGGPYLLKCNFRLCDLPAKISPFYEECLTLWSKFNTTNPNQVKDILNEIIWNNKNILINKKLCFYSDLVDAGMHRICDIVKPNGHFYTLFDLQSKNIQPRNFLSWYGLIDAIPANWKKELKSKAIPHTPPFDPQDYYLLLNSVKVSLSEMDTKTLYEAHVSDLRETPTAQLRYNEMLHDSELMQNKIYSLPFQVALDTYTRDFQYKILNRILFTNSKLFKLKLVESPLCSFCDKNEETLEHLFCEHSKAFWKEISSWLHECGIETLPDLTDQINVMFGLFDVDNHFKLLNYIMLIAKQTEIYFRKL